MDNVDNSVKTSEVADAPEIKSHKNPMDDDAFWKDEELEADEPEMDEPEGEEPEAEELEADEPKVKEKPKQTDDDNSKFAAARRESEKRAAEKEKELKELRDKQEGFAKSYGYNSFDEMEKAVKTQQYIEQGYDVKMAEKLVQIDNYEKDLQTKLNSARIAEEKSKLKNEPYFKEFENEVDEILAHNNGLEVSLVFDVVKGRNAKRIVELAQKSATQKALNDIASKKHIKPDGKGVDISDIHVDEAEWNFYKKLNPKAKREDWVKFLKKEKRS